MPDRIVMDIVNMRCQIPLVADQMLPEAPLPNRLLAASASGLRSRRHSDALAISTREDFFD